MRADWATTLLKLGSIVGLTTLGGLVFGLPLAGFALGCLFGLLQQLHGLWLFERWVGTGKMDDPPEGLGVWAHLYARTSHLNRRSAQYRARHRQLLRELRRSSNALPLGVIFLNELREIMYMNRSAASLLGLRRRRDRGQRVDNLLRQPEFVAYLRGSQDAQMPQISSPLQPGGWLVLQRVAYAADQEMLLVRDVTREAEASRMRRDFVANASHELRTPLTVVSGYLDALVEDGNLNATWARPLGEMQRQLARMRSIIDDLMHISRLENTNAKAEFDPVDLVALMHAAVLEARALDISVDSIEVEAASDVQVLGDEQDVRSIIGNLVSNAVRYTQKTGHIRLRWDVSSNGGVLSVSDDGAGIASEHMPRLTERFYRVDSGRARDQGGTGLGLAIVKHALGRHDGVLEIHSEPGQGSTFSCRFPANRLASPASRVVPLSQ